MDLGVYVWVDGSYQNVGRTTAEGAQYLRDTSIDGGAMQHLVVITMKALM